LKEHGNRILDTKKDNSDILFRFDIERINTLTRMSEWFIDSGFPKMMGERKPQTNPDGTLTVEDVGKILKGTPQTVYKLIKKGKFQAVEISTIDKPGLKPKSRVRRGEVERWLDGRYNIWMHN
jgi:hypothetical protein